MKTNPFFKWYWLYKLTYHVVYCLKLISRHSLLRVHEKKNSSDRFLSVGYATLRADCERRVSRYSASTVAGRHRTSLCWARFNTVKLYYSGFLLQWLVACVPWICKYKIDFFIFYTFFLSSVIMHEWPALIDLFAQQSGRIDVTRCIRFFCIIKLKR